jgi:hypothetical protein
LLCRLSASPDGIKPALRSRILLKGFSQDYTGIIAACGTAFQVFLLCTFPYFTRQTSGKNPSGVSTATVTIGNISRTKAHAVFFIADRSNFIPHRCLPGYVRFHCCQMDGTGVA